jgi:hypothetical protein
MERKVLFASLMLAVFWLGSPEPAAAVTGKASAITFVDEANERQIYAFVEGDTGRLMLNRFDGTSWSWADHGLPPGVLRIIDPTAITYVDASGNRRIYVFALAPPTAESDSRLVLRFWNGFQWQWSDHGSYYSLEEGTLSATTFLDDEGNRRIYLFGIRSWTGGRSAVKARLTARHWDGSNWQWEDHGVDSDASCRQSFTETIHYRDHSGYLRVEVFCVSPNLYLFKRRLSNGSWSWISQGGDQILLDRGSVLTFDDASGDPEVHAFVARQAPYRDLIQNFGYSWNPLGSPPTELSPPTGISAIAYVDSDGDRRIRVFVEYHRRLYARSWTGSTWTYWTDYGLPAPEPQGQLETNDAIAAITYLDCRSGKQRIHVFATGIYGNMFVNYWDGNSWQWQDNGKP